MGRIAQEIDERSSILTRTIELKRIFKYKYKLIRLQPFSFYKIERGCGLFFTSKYGQIYSSVYPEIVVNERCQVKLLLWGTDIRYDEEAELHIFYDNRPRIKRFDYNRKLVNLLLDWEQSLFNSHG